MSIKTFTGTATTAVDLVSKAGGTYTLGTLGVFSYIENLLLGNTVTGINTTLTGNFNVCVGAYTGSNTTTGSQNTFTGRASGFANTTGSNNTFVGFNAGAACTAGTENIVMGTLALSSLTTGAFNVALGTYAGISLTTGTNNTFLGRNCNDGQHTTGSGNTLIGANLTSYGNISNTILISDGANTKNIIADSASCRTTAPVRPPQFTFAVLPSASTSGLGSICYCTNGRKSGEAAAAGTGCPVFSNGTSWLTFYGNTAITA